MNGYPRFGWVDILRFQQSGMMMLLRETHSSKALLPILVTESGMRMFLREIHPSKALYPILVTESGMWMLMRELQPENILLVDYQCYTL